MSMVLGTSALRAQSSINTTLQPTYMHTDIYSRNVDYYQNKANIYDTIDRHVQEMNMKATNPYFYNTPNQFNSRPPANSSDADQQYIRNYNNSNLNNSNIYRPQLQR